MVKYCKLAQETPPSQVITCRDATLAALEAAQQWSKEARTSQELTHTIEELDTFMSELSNASDLM